MQRERARRRPLWETQSANPVRSYRAGPGGMGLLSPNVSTARDDPGAKGRASWGAAASGCVAETPRAAAVISWSIMGPLPGGIDVVETRSKLEWPQCSQSVKSGSSGQTGSPGHGGDFRRRPQQPRPAVRAPPSGQRA